MNKWIHPLRGFIFTCIFFTMLTLGEWLHTHQPETLMAYIAICLGLLATLVYKLLDSE